MRGSKITLTKAVTAKLVRGWREGGSDAVAAAVAGIGKRTLERWLETGHDEGGDARCRQLVTARETARGKRAMASLRVINRSKDPRAHQWWLAMTYPDDYGKNRLELTGKDGGPIATQAQLVEAAGAVPADEVAAMIAAGRAAMAAKKQKKQHAKETAEP